MISEILLASELDEHDQDIATSGLCGTFALAIKAVCPEVSLHLVCLTDRDGVIIQDKDGVPHWRHVVAKADGRLFDVDGEVEPKHVIDNYCWGNPRGGHGDFLEVSETRLLEIVRSDRRSFDETWFAKWVSVLERSRVALMDRKAEPVPLAPCSIW
jgi:hypothetical protein